MKQTFLKFMPLVAAVVFAVSCSKNDDNGGTADIVEQPAEEVGGGYVKTPFSVKVDNDSGLSVISYEAMDGGSAKVARHFVEGDKGTVLTVTSRGAYGDGGDMIYAIKPSTLTLASDDNINFYFTGDISVSSDSLERFKGTSPDAPPITLTGVLGTAISGFAHSTESLADLMSNCNHQYEGVFASDQTDAIVFTDKNAYLAIGLPATETSVNINDKSFDLNLGRCWIAFDPTSTKITSEALGLSGNEASAGSVHTVCRKAFSVSANKKVHFSMGNLQATYDGSAWLWGFADNQYDYLGNTSESANEKINGDGTVSANGTVDLFGWVGASSNWDGAAMYGISNSLTANSADTYGTGDGEALKSDWGTLVGDGKTWRTLTASEWQYLLGTAEERKDKNGLGTITIGTNTYFGWIILPDGYTDPEGVAKAFVPGATSQAYSASDWSAMEADGAVFLPAAGFRVGASVKDVGLHGVYWSSSASGTLQASRMGFREDYLSPADDRNRFVGFSVRLVRPL